MPHQDSLSAEISDHQLLFLSDSALKAIAKSQPDFPSLLKWARMGALCEGIREQADEDGCMKFLSAHINISFFKSLLTKKDFSDAQYADLLLAASEGLSRLERLSGRPETPPELTCARCIEDLYRGTPSFSGAYSERLKTQSLPHFSLDPRISISPFSAHFFQLIISNHNSSVWEQIKQKTGFEDQLATLFKSSVELRDAIRRSCIYEAHDTSKPLSPGVEAFKILAPRGLFSSDFILPMAYVPHPSHQISKDFAFRKAHIDWPAMGLDREKPAFVLHYAINGMNSGTGSVEDLDFFFDHFTLSDLEKDGFKSLYSRNFTHPLYLTPLSGPLLWQAALLLPSEYFTKLVDRIDQEEPQAWSRWLSGSSPLLSLDQKNEKQIDLLTALCSLEHHPSTLKKIISKIPSFSFTPSRATIRWLKERSIKASDTHAKETATRILRLTLPLEEAFELQHTLDTKVTSVPLNPAKRRSL